MSGPLFRNFIHQSIIDNLSEIEAWFQDRSKGKPQPFYASFDIRDSHLKAACVDANMFPGGFNNICPEDKQRTENLIKDYLEKEYKGVKKILLLTEEHTRNPYYWDNIFIIKSLIEYSGKKVQVCVPGKFIKEATQMHSASGRKVDVRLIGKEKGDLIISNNDFSSLYDLPEIECRPPVRMGWLERKKIDFFEKYNNLATEFAGILNIDPWHFTVETKLFSPFDMEKKESLQSLKKEASSFLKNLKKKMENLNIKEDPYLFLKNNSGTYGLGILNIQDPEKELESLTYKNRKKMKGKKGDVRVDELIIQEGIPTAIRSEEGQTAEPVIYTIGHKVTGGFLRTHGRKDEKTNLNSPGSVFKRLCLSDLEVKIQGLAMENVYSWLAKIGTLALSEELETGM